MARRMGQRNKHLPLTMASLTDVIFDDSITTGKTMFVAKTIKNPLRRMPLLAVDRSVRLQNAVNDSREGIQLRALRVGGCVDIPAVPNAAVSSSQSRAKYQTEEPLRVGSDPVNDTPAEHGDINPRYTSSYLPSQERIEGQKWQSFTPPRPYN